jgi:ribonucleoside-diphosphate reductase alpha chain
MKRETLDLTKLENAIKTKEEIHLTKNDTIKASKLTIIKRDGSKEPYNVKKIRKVVSWATENKDVFTDELLKDTEIKLYEEIKITDLYDELIKTAINKISLLYPQWEYITAKLYLLKLYKETWNAGKEFYPDFLEYINKGLQYHVFDKETINSYTEDELIKIGNMIVRERDYLFTWKALLTFSEKYCLKYSKTKRLELPQHTYMRVAMSLCVNEKNRLDRIKETYDLLSQHKYTVGTPIIINALTPKQNLSSCVLSKIGDDTHSIMDTIKNLAVYSKHRGGTACDITDLRSRGAVIKGTNGISSGPVPFIKVLESTMKAWNQSSIRPGACCVYFPWWHLDVFDLVVLKSNGGTDENRARGLKYSIKVNEYFLNKVVLDEEITLFDPNEVPQLKGVVGEQFDKAYQEYEGKTNIKKRVVSARELWYAILKERVEHGNLYLFHEENTNKTSMLNRYINSSNLCMEIALPSRASEQTEETFIIKETGEKEIVKKYKSGEIALCNLASINLVEYFAIKDENERFNMIYNVVRMMDNTIDVANYPVKEAAITNKEYRYLGIGVSNFANELANRKIVIDSEEALYETHKIFDELSYNCIKASVELAKERGRYEKFEESKWADGVLPIDIANENAISIVPYKINKKKWNALRKDIQLFGIRNAALMAIAPTATSGKAINATESIEPIQMLFYREEGTFSANTIVPNFRKNNKYYKTAFDCDTEKLIELAAIRQIYLDQSQSVNLYFANPDSAMELTKHHLKAFNLGVKTLYYMKSMKDSDEYVCESCT